MTSAPFQAGDPVWAKYSTFRFWPGKIASNDEWMKPIPSGKQCVYFFGSHNLGIVAEDRIVHANSYVDEPKKSPKETLRFKSAVEELNEYLKDRPKQKPGRKPTQKISPSQEITIKVEQSDEPDDQGTSGMPSGKLSPMFRLFYGGKLSGMQVKRREISPSEIAKNERAEAEFGALVNGENTPFKKNGFEQTQTSLYELPSNKKRRIDSAVSRKPSLPSIGFIGVDFFLSNLLQSFSNNKKMNIFFSHVDHVNTNKDGFKPIYTCSRDLFSSCDLIFIGASDENLLNQIFLSCDSSHLEAISERTSLVLSSKVSPKVSLEIEKKIQERGGRFLDVKAFELPGGGRLLLAGGDKYLFEDCKAQYFSKISTDCKFYEQRQSLALYSNLQFLRCINVISLLEVQTCLSELLVPEEGFREAYKLTQMQSAAGEQILDSTFKLANGPTLQDLLSDAQMANNFCNSEMGHSALIPLVVQLLKNFVEDGKGGLKLDQLNGALFN